MVTWRDFEWWRLTYASSSCEGGFTSTWVSSTHPAIHGNPAVSRNFAATFSGLSGQQINPLLRLSIAGTTQCIMFQTVEVEMLWHECITRKRELVPRKCRNTWSWSQAVNALFLLVLCSSSGVSAVNRYSKTSIGRRYFSLNWRGFWTSKRRLSSKFLGCLIICSLNISLSLPR